VDEQVFVNEQGHVTEGTITNIFVQKDGILRTPPVNDGVLPGILRSVLIADGRAEVGHLTWDDVVASPLVYVGNSLRGLIRARV
jgi:branched-subunit amino acid aminotransferase/4-amino-4-deoxychorismate lyase